MILALTREAFFEKSAEQIVLSTILQAFFAGCIPQRISVPLLHLVDMKEW